MTFNLDDLFKKAGVERPPPEMPHYDVFGPTPVGAWQAGMSRNILSGLFCSFAFYESEEGVARGEPLFSIDALGRVRVHGKMIPGSDKWFRHWVESTLDAFNIDTMHKHIDRVYGEDAHKRYEEG